MKKNEELQKDVQNAIKWEPLLNAAEIGVTVKDGVVTLTGVVNTYSKKAEAEDAAKNVAGVVAVVEKIEVKFGNYWGEKDDNEIATAVVNAFSWNWQIPTGKIQVKVEKGWVTLEGEVEWNTQKDAAKDAVKNLLGVTGVYNNITVKSENQNLIEKREIERALQRNWATKDRFIRVNVSDHNIRLSGTVHAWFQKDEAGRIAWNAPGVWSVDNDLLVDNAYINAN
jgi:osmotically-inducible protein OsmY